MTAEHEAAPICAPALDLVKQYEGLYLSAYRCPAGVPTIGYGHTKGVKMGQKITREQAERFLSDDLAEAAERVDKLVTVPLTEEELGALASFVFNVGAGAFEKSTMRKKLNAGDYDGAANEFARWNKAGGKVLPGLVKRRAAEAALFLSGSHGAEGRMPQAVEAPAAMKPLTQSSTVRAGGAGLAVSAAVSMLPEVTQQVEQARGVVDQLRLLLPNVSNGWLVSAVLVLAVGYMLYRRWDDKRKGEA